MWEGNGVVEILWVWGVFGYFGECGVDVVLGVVLGGCGKRVFVGDVEDVGEFLRSEGEEGLKRNGEVGKEVE